MIVRSQKIDSKYVRKSRSSAQMQDSKCAADETKVLSKASCERVQTIKLIQT